MRAIVILGAAVWSDGPSPTLRRRVARAVALWRADPQAALVPCGGCGTHPPTEAEAMRALLREAGVPPAAIHPETASRNTAENIRGARPILEGLGATDVVIVTDWFHAPRARLVARRAGLRASVACPPLRGARPWPQLKGALREVPALLAYAIGFRH